VLVDTLLVTTTVFATQKLAIRHLDLSPNLHDHDSDHPNCYNASIVVGSVGIFLAQHRHFADPVK